jgi:hypothetical protein
MLVEHQLVGALRSSRSRTCGGTNPIATVCTRGLEDEYGLRERMLALKRKLEVASGAAQTMLDLHQAKRSLNVEYYIVVALIVVEIGLG